MKGDRKDEYESEAEYLVDCWPEWKLLRVVPMCEESAREFLAVCNRRGESKALREHFHGCAQDARERGW